jgi:hypothetical protein
MRCLITTIKTANNLTIAKSQRVVEGLRVTIGRGTDRDIQVADDWVGLKHAAIYAGKNSVQIRASSVTGVIVNDRLCRVSRLQPGDVINIGENNIRVLDNFDQSLNETFDLNLCIEAAEDREVIEIDEQRYKTSLKKTRLISKRQSSWILFVSLIFLGLLIPLIFFVSSDNMQTLRKIPLPDDSIWSTGKLHRGHSFMGDGCENCHQKAFQKVENKACVNCHSGIENHLSDEHGGTELNGQDCAYCHKEHQGENNIIRQDEASCIECHQNIKHIDADSKLANVGDFGEAHPNFKVSLLVAASNPQQQSLKEEVVWSQIRRDINSADLKEKNNLKFSHKEHLNTAGIENETGAKEIMQCSACHQPQLDGGIMKPIAMEQHCSRCHRMEFDPNNPNRQIPHGEPNLVILTLKEYYSRQLLEGLTDATNRTQGKRQIRRPGSSPKKTKKQSQKEYALEWAMQQTTEIAADLIERKACVSCHQVTVDNDQPLAKRWTIKPVKIISQWYPKSRFSHRRHETMQCIDCHDASESETSENILMPDINNCRDCHSSNNDDSKVSSTCVLCHGFHGSNESSTTTAKIQWSP